MTNNENDTLDDIRAADKAEQDGKTVVLHFATRLDAEMALQSIERMRAETD